MNMHPEFPQYRIATALFDRRIGYNHKLAARDC
jgi:hypothetical protein